MTGPDFRALSEREQYDIIPRLQVLARSSPIDKVKLKPIIFSYIFFFFFF
jgi:magnesium-transporting ATPase (P-type)